MSEETTVQGERLVCPNCGSGEDLREWWWNPAEAPTLAVRKEDGSVELDSDYGANRNHYDAFISGGVSCGNCEWGLDHTPTLRKDEDGDLGRLLTADEWNKQKEEA